MPEQLIPSADQIIAFFVATWSGYIVTILIITGGLISKAVARWRGWRGAGRFYDMTLRLHPIVAGFLFGLVPFPTFESIDSIRPTFAMVLVRCCYFAAWGCVSGQLYEFAKFWRAWFPKYLELKTGVRVSTTPSEPPVSGETTAPTSPRAKREADDGGEA